MSTMMRSGEKGGHLGDEIALASLDDVVHDSRRGGLDVRAERVELTRGEAAGHDASHPGMARVVEVDHRAEELVEGVRHVTDVRSPA